MKYTKLFFSLLFLLTFQSHQAFALIIDNERNGTISIDENDPSITINPGGNLVNGRIFGALSSNLVVNINANDGQGVRSDSAALHAVLATLTVNLNSGRIANNTDSAGEVSGAVLLINSIAQENNIINIAAAGSIIGETANARAINYRNHANDATLTINNFGSILSADNEASRGIWFFDPSGGSTLILNNFGVMNSGAGQAVDVEDANLAIITNTGGTITGDINLGANANSRINVDGGSISGKITFGNAAQEINLSNYGQFDGTVLGDGKINLGSYSSLNLNGGSSASQINAISEFSRGSLSLKANQEATINSIGQTHALVSFNVNNAATANVSGNIAADNINLSGELNLTNADGNLIKGNLTGFGSAILNLNEGSHALDGNLTLAKNNKIAVTIADPDRAGSIIVSGMANINTRNLLLTLGSNQTAVGAKYTLISADDGSSLKEMNIDVDASGSNRLGIYVFNTKISGNSLILEVDRYKVAVLSSSPQSGFYEAILNANNPSGNLLLLQEYLDSQAISDAQKMTVLNSANSEVDNSHNRLAFNNVDLSANLISKRLDVVRQGAAGLSSGDETLSKSVWMELFGSSVKQGNVGSHEGYDAKSSGFTFGFDKNLEDRDITAGLAFTYAGSSVESSLGGKKTDIENYQLNLYGSKNFDSFYINAVVGAALNRYDSSRRIDFASTSASANYNGSSYVARVEIATRKQLANKLTITPSLMLTAARNNISSYQEEGAENLNLFVKNNSTNFLEARAGVKAQKEYLFKSNIVTPHLNISYGYDFIGDRQKVTANFVGQTTTFSSSAARIAQASLRLGGGVEMYNQKNITLNVEYNFEHRNNYAAHLGSLRAKYSF